MPFEREPIFHDINLVFSLTNESITSSSFVDITGATLTAADLSQPSIYKIWFSVTVFASIANTVARFRMLVNGIPLIPDGRPLNIKTNNEDFEKTFYSVLTDIVEGDTFQIQWSTDKGTLTLEEFDFMFEGIPEIRNVSTFVSTIDNIFLEDGADLLQETGELILHEQQTVFTSF